jgi:hypothetical protein
LPDKGDLTTPAPVVWATLEVGGVRVLVCVPRELLNDTIAELRPDVVTIHASEEDVVDVVETLILRQRGRLQ